MSKGILGLGDSFMWGESVYFYSKLPNLPFGKYHGYDSNSITAGMSEYKNKHRYIQLVANYYDTWCSVKNVNGSNNTRNLEIVSRLSEFKTYYEAKFDFNLNVDDYKLIVFQFTSIYRDDVDTYELLSKLHTYFSKFEQLGIKVITLAWMREIYEHPIYQKLYLNRHVDIEINNTIYPVFEPLINDDSLNVTVKSDFEKDNLQINDIHLNHKGNKCFADSIIKKLEQDNFKI